jgi:signal transduction histidine kinase
MLLAPACLTAGELRPQSILVLDQSDLRGSFYYEVFSELRAAVNAQGRSHITLYTESLDLSRFKGEAYEESLREHLQVKYRDTPIGVIVAIGAATLQHVLNWREELWPNIPVVFTMVNERDLATLRPPPTVTGSLIQVRLSDALAAARAVVPDLDRVVLVGDSWSSQTVFGSWQDEIPSAASGLQVEEIIGFTMTEIRRRVAALEDRSAILYTAVYSDGEGAYYPSGVALGLIAEKANRPIIVASETLIDRGGIGGFVLLPARIGADAASRALRVLDGEDPAQISTATLTDAVKPIFNWQQMNRWGVGEAALPTGSEVRFRDPGLWEQYRWQSIAATAAIVLQAVLISGLLQERRKRNSAETEARDRMTELAHVNRQAAAGELSSSIAHELNQPLGSILTNTETAELILQSSSPDLKEIEEILADIKRDDLRASEVINRLRSFLKRVPFEIKTIDINATMNEVFAFLTVQASSRNVAVYLTLSPGELNVSGDSIQLQQVIINLMVNGMDAMASMPYGKALIGKTEIDGLGMAIVSISDSGPGIPADKLNQIFDPFFTTKQKGMGVGLSIARTIVQAHKGRIWAENHSSGGAVFRIALPLAQPS